MRYKYKNNNIYICVLFFFRSCNKSACVNSILSNVRCSVKISDYIVASCWIIMVSTNETSFDCDIKCFLPNGNLANNKHRLIICKDSSLFVSFLQIYLDIVQMNTKAQINQFQFLTLV